MFSFSTRVTSFVHAQSRAVLAFGIVALFVAVIACTPAGSTPATAAEALEGYWARVFEEDGKLYVSNTVNEFRFASPTEGKITTWAFKTKADVISIQITSYTGNQIGLVLNTGAEAAVNKNIPITITLIKKDLIQWNMAGEDSFRQIRVKKIDPNN